MNVRELEDKCIEMQRYIDERRVEIETQRQRIRELETALGEALDGLDSEIDADRIATLRRLLTPRPA